MNAIFLGLVMARRQKPCRGALGPLTRQVGAGALEAAANRHSESRLSAAAVTFAEHDSRARNGSEAQEPSARGSHLREQRAVIGRVTRNQTPQLQELDLV